ncbi:hypothetical protein [Streptomyces longwoodensis]|uniref:hypothetical protein n=1 Tax=Streptomyces longwoodensis TaxID=68231 RepID=UPI001FE18D80|nr:hypothetical protein [Streptomyces longwoodensis]
MTRVDRCGNPVQGNDNAFVAECFSSIAFNNNVDDGDDIEYKAANGKVCGYRRGCPTFRGFDVEINFFAVSPELIELLTGNPVYLDASGEVIGTDTCSLQCKTGFALELWAEVLGEDCDEGSTGQWIYFVLPWITNGLLGDMEIGGEAVTLQVTGATRAGGNWGAGPYNVTRNAGGAPSPMLTPLGPTCHRRIFITDVAPPVPSCDYVPVPVPATP